MHRRNRILAPAILAAMLLVQVRVAAGGDNAADLRVDERRIEARIRKLSEFGRNADGGVSRVAFSEADIRGRAYLKSLMREAGLDVSVDAAGNIIGRRQGREPGLPPIVFGSHGDSVPHGGNYDGNLGVIAAIECAQVLAENGVTTRHPLEAVVFTDEEGGLIGSKAMAGELTAGALEEMSHSGKRVGDGIEAVGGDPGRIFQVARKPGDIKAFIELHIEQGAVLYDEKIDIGVVEGIVGINWWDVTVEGFANHAGTTPMNKRRDAMLAAARLTVAVNEVVTGVSGRQVGTVGRIAAEPGAPNVIPGKVVMSLEIRDLSAEKIQMLFGLIRERAAKIARASGTKIRFSPIDATAVPAPTDVRMRKIISGAAKKLGLTNKLMPSGAGHDAQDMARIAPTGMIFVPSVGGISHSPKEYTPPKDMANGADVLLHTVLAIDRGALGDK